MQTKPKANSIITSRFDEERNIIVFTVLGEGEVELDLTKVSPANMARAAVHGWNQRIPAAAAIGVTDKDGTIIPKAERTRIKYERMNDLCRFYESGTEEWARRAAGGGGGRSLVIEAIAALRDVTYESVSEHLDREALRLNVTRPKLLASLRADAEIAAKMREIEDSRVAKGADASIDLGSVLSGLGEQAEE